MWISIPCILIRFYSPNNSHLGMQARVDFITIFQSIFCCCSLSLLHVNKKIIIFSSKFLDKHFSSLWLCVGSPTRLKTSCCCSVCRCQLSCWFNKSLFFLLFHSSSLFTYSFLLLVCSMFVQMYKWLQAKKHLLHIHTYKQTHSLIYICFVKLQSNSYTRIGHINWGGKTQLVHDSMPLRKFWRFGNIFVHERRYEPEKWFLAKSCSILIIQTCIWKLKLTIVTKLNS